MKIMLLVAAGVAVGLTAVIAVLIQVLAQLLPLVIAAVIAVVVLRMTRHHAALRQAGAGDQVIAPGSVTAAALGPANADHAASYLSWGPVNDDDWVTPAGAAGSRQP